MQELVLVVDKNQTPLMPTTVVDLEKSLYVGGEMVKPTKKTRHCGLEGFPSEQVSQEEPLRKVISLHSLLTGKRLTQSANPKDLNFLTYNTWRTKWAG
jgi:hypothetical protein